MKTIALKPGSTDVHLSEAAEPNIQTATEIKAQVVCVGVCGTDREEAAGGRADAPAGEKELIIGHEMLGRVTEVGAKVTSLKVGDYVVITVRRGCATCSACNMNRSDLCLTGRYTERGIKGRHGFQAEYVVDEEAFAIKVPAAIAHVGVLAEPMSVVQKAIEEAALIQQARLPYLPKSTEWLHGKTVFIAGLGPIGLLAALVLRLRGAKVFGLDIVDTKSPRVEILSEIGGTYIYGKGLDPKKLASTYPSIDMIVDAAGCAQLDFDLLEALGINGIFVLTGVPGDQRSLSIDGAEIMRKLVLKNQVVVGSVNESIAHFKKGISDIEAATKKWPGVVEKMITQRFNHTDFEKALSHHSQDEIKVVIEWKK